MKTLFVCLFTCLSSFVYASEPYTIYLVRHAEKAKLIDNKNPPLTSCGHARAEHISRLLSRVNLEHIYSTDYLRTQSTASPTAKFQSLDISRYDPYKLNELAKQLVKEKKNTLVVGHSNTTNVLAGILSNQDIENINESEYDLLFQITLFDDQTHLQLLQQSFRCAAVAS